MSDSDLGLARPLDGKRPTDGVGTIRCQAPEVVDFLRSYGERYSSWQPGVLAFQLLWGTEDMPCGLTHANPALEVLDNRLGYGERYSTWQFGIVMAEVLSGRPSTRHSITTTAAGPSRPSRSSTTTQALQWRPGAVATIAVELWATGGTIAFAVNDMPRRAWPITLPPRPRRLTGTRLEPRPCVAEATCTVGGSIVDMLIQSP